MSLLAPSTSARAPDEVEAAQDRLLLAPPCQNIPAYPHGSTRAPGARCLPWNSSRRKTIGLYQTGAGSNALARLSRCVLLCWSVADRPGTAGSGQRRSRPAVHRRLRDPGRARGTTSRPGAVQPAELRWGKASAARRGWTPRLCAIRFQSGRWASMARACDRGYRRRAY